MSNTNELMQNIIPQSEGVPELILNGHELTSPEKIEKVEKKMLDMPQAECSVKHYFGAGICIREVFIPAGVFSVGHHQNFEHMNHIVKGRVIMFNDDGTTKEVSEGETFVCPPGRKIGIILEDMIWRNIYPTDETDIDAIEAKFVTQSDGWLSDKESKDKIEYLNHHQDRKDYESFAKECGLEKKEKEIQLSTKIKMPAGNYNYKISKSPIHGYGTFATSSIKESEVITTADKIVINYINHSPSPSAKVMLVAGKGLCLVANKDIQGCHGGNSGEEITINYRTLSNIRGVLCQ